MLGCLAVVGADGLAGLRLQHQAQRFGGHTGDQFFGVAVIGHDDHRQLLVRQHAQLRGKIVAAATVLVGAHTGADRFIAARCQKPTEAHLAIEIQRIAGVLLGEHLINRCTAHHALTFIEALGEQHLHVVAEVFGACPQPPRQRGPARVHRYSVHRLRSPGRESSTAYRCRQNSTGSSPVA